MDRRHFLQSAAGVVGGLGVGSIAGIVGTSIAGADDAPTVAAVPLFGQHQAGVLQSRQTVVSFLAFDVTATDRNALARLFQALAGRARVLTAGAVPNNLGISAPPADSGLLGPTIVPDNLTITVGVGASLFDGRYGLAKRKPKHLRQMETFPNDNLNRTICDGDLLIQLTADHPDTLVHAMLDLTKNTRAWMQPRWRMDGGTPPPRPDGAPRNYLGFKDGIANPDVTDDAEMNRLVWVQPNTAGEPAWTAGGSYHVIRIIRMLTEFWNRVGLTEQERMIGRRKDSGAPLIGGTEDAVFDYTNDGAGDGIPIDAHIRVANPRTPATDSSRILRRGYNYDSGIDTNGNLEMGLLFSCFQQNLDRQFVAVQKRLADEPLVDYISPIGGGYFFTLPGLTSAADWYARSLLA
jgi:deferrochelatase/peroxidase EfeB